jgi:hypothetical protein
MTESGLPFASTVEGAEAAYLAVHRALAAYDTPAHADICAPLPPELPQADTPASQGLPLLRILAERARR